MLVAFPKNKARFALKLWVSRLLFITTAYIRLWYPFMTQMVLKLFSTLCWTPPHSSYLVSYAKSAIWRSPIIYSVCFLTILLHFFHQNNGVSFQRFGIFSTNTLTKSAMLQSDCVFKACFSFSFFVNDCTPAPLHSCSSQVQFRYVGVCVMTKVIRICTTWGLNSGGGFAWLEVKMCVTGLSRFDVFRKLNFLLRIWPNGSL